MLNALDVKSPTNNAILYGGFGVPWFILPNHLQNNNKFRKQLDDLIFCNILNNLIDKRVSSFIWEGLPDTCDARVMELILLFWGNIGMYKDEMDNYICNGLVPYGKNGINRNGEPLDGWLYSFTGQSQEVKLWVTGIDNKIARESSTRKIVDNTFDCVRGRENSLGIPFFQFIYEKALRLAQRENILDASIENCRQPLIVTCQEQDFKSVKKELEDIDDNRTRIVMYNGVFDKNALQVLDTHIKPEIVQIVREEIVRMQNECDKMMGINSTPYEKKERLLTDEVNSNNQSTCTNIEQSLLWRQKFCEDCNLAFGLNMSVDFRFREEVISRFDESKEEEGREERLGEEETLETETL